MAIVAVSVFIAFGNRAPRPAPFVALATAINAPSFHAGSWYWIERRGKQAQTLVRANESGSVRTIVSANEIADFDATDNVVLVVLRTDKTWHVQLGTVAGQLRDLWVGTQQPHGTLISAGQAYWILSRPPNPTIGDIPPLQQHIELTVAPVAGGPSRTISTIMEPDGLQIIGINDGSIYLSAFRDAVHGVTTIYRAPMAGGAPKRVAGETGKQFALISDAGLLYWTAPCHDSQNYNLVGCVRRLASSGATETLTGWITAGGRLYNTRHGVWYVDQSAPSTAIPITTYNDLPRATAVASGFNVLAANSDTLLLEPATAARDGKSPLYRMWPK